jgi:hypothetical protein
LIKTIAIYAYWQDKRYHPSASLFPTIPTRHALFDTLCKQIIMYYTYTQVILHLTGEYYTLQVIKETRPEHWQAILLTLGAKYPKLRNA